MCQEKRKRRKKSFCKKTKNLKKGLAKSKSIVYNGGAKAHKSGGKWVKFPEQTGERSVNGMSGHGLIGNYQHSFDAKGRLFIPAKLREDLGDSVYMTRGLEGCIFLFSREGWDEFVAGLENAAPLTAREATRFFGGNAGASDIDAQGRIIVPANLRAISNIGKDVTVVGVLNRLEIWNTDKWEAFNQEITDDRISDLLEKMGN